MEGFDWDAGMAGHPGHPLLEPQFSPSRLRHPSRFLIFLYSHFLPVRRHAYPWTTPWERKEGHAPNHLLPTASFSHGNSRFRGPRSIHVSGWNGIAYAGGSATARRRSCWSRYDEPGHRGRSEIFPGFTPWSLALGGLGLGTES